MSEIVKKLEEARDNKRYLTVDDLNEAIAALQPGGERERWHIGTMNDGLFIINTKPQPAPVDYPFHDRKDGPTLVIPVSALGSERANEIVTAHNKAVGALLRSPVAVTVDDAMVEKIARRIAPNNGDTADIAWEHLVARGEHHQYLNTVRDVLKQYAALSAALAGEVK